MKLIVLTDTHLGARGSSEVFREYMRGWFEELFEKSQEESITEWIHAGDFFDNRNHLGLNDIQFVCEYLAPKLKEYNINLTIVVGNHDVYYRNTNRVTSLTMLKSVAPDNVELILEPTTKKYGTQSFVLLPWINQENYDDSLQAIDSAMGSIIVGHLEVQGFKHYKNSPPSEHGISQDKFLVAKDVWSGHYHHKMQIGNIQYLGSAFHLTWNDYDDHRGYHIYDTETEELTYYPNDSSLFIRETYIEGERYDDEKYTNKFVQLIVDDTEYSKVKLLDAMAQINTQRPINLEVINKVEFSKKQEEEFDEINYGDVEVKSTWSYIEDNIEGESEWLKEKIKSIYNTSMNKLYDGEA